MNLDPKAFLAAPELIQALEESAVSIHCREERMLFRQGEEAQGLYVVSGGTVDLQMTAPDGHSIMTAQVAAGALLGLPGLISNSPYTLTAVARPGAHVGYISRTDFTRLMQSHPALSLKILQVLAAEVSSARRALVEM